MQTNDTGDQEPGGAAVVPPDEKDGAQQQPSQFLEIVWSSPAFTSPASSPTAAAPSNRTPRASTRIVHAFESDFLDSHVTWDEESKPVSEPETPSKKKSRPTSRTAGSKVRLLDIYPADPRPTPQQIEFPFPREGTSGVPAVIAGQAAFPTHAFQPSVEQPMVDGRPTGMVFFETMGPRPMLPRNVVYSTNEPVFEAEQEPAAQQEPELSEIAETVTEPAQEPAESKIAIPPPPDLQAIIARARPETAAVESAVKAFFDFPDDLPAVPSEDTDDPYEAPPPAKRRTYGHRFLNILSWCILLGFFMTVAVGLLYGRYAHKRLYYAESGSKRIVNVVVQPGDTFRGVLDKLRKQGVLGSYFGLSDQYLMRYLAHLNENSNKIKPGAYRVDSNASLSDIYNKLIEGSKDFKITIPEGKTAREVATEVKRRYPEFDDVRFMELITDSAFIKKLEIDTPSLEGYLYPSTYFFGPGMKEEDLVKLMVNTFKQNYETKIKPLAPSDEFSLHQHVIMASLIEREARMDEDRPLIASVIYNRLKKDMPLQIDATVNYALNDWRKLSLNDLKVDSPYNTYKNKGLPPGPIASPRIESLLATYTAPQTEFLFYVYQGDGRHAFSTTYEEFLANKHQFQKSGAEPSNFNAGALETTKPIAAGTPTAPSKRSRK